MTNFDIQPMPTLTVPAEADRSLDVLAFRFAESFANSPASNCASKAFELLVGKDGQTGSIVEAMTDEMKKETK